jgi:ADP-heptose:LPS heptosyltransferase
VEILVLHPGALGDIILSLPATALLQSPSARITIAGNLDYLAVVASGYAENVISLSTVPLHRLYSGEPLQETDVRFWRRFDRIVSWTGAGDPEFVARLKEIRPEACVAPWRPGPGETRHVSQIFADSLGTGISAHIKPPGIMLSESTHRRGKQWLSEKGWNGRETLVALHPGAGSEAKRWPAPQVSGLAQYLVQKNIRLLIIEGPAETGLAGQIARTLPSGAAITAESEPLELLAAAMKNCCLFIGNDSGLAHLAAALDIRSIVLFGPTLPQNWAPLGRDVTVLRNAAGCAACGTNSGRHTCLGNISVKEVIGVIQDRSEPRPQGSGSPSGFNKT